MDNTIQKRCGNCYGNGGMYITPATVSPPSRKFDGGYEPNSSIKHKIYVVCDGCNGKGHITMKTQ